ncbi:hypothetical protein SAMN05216241_11819 [Limimonas halophila]|uniref:Metal dependent phosphohydrolase n=2 Tax=Limimonas halophila TaxID=1082479 RepID=A0A1G7UYN1_9PROT|nr:hypothetical protein SAMN05216241_11819 [Limimonas halophila]
MLSGRRLDLVNPSPLDIEIDDIAHGLSRVARWNGQTYGEWPFSVAQHALLVEHIAGKLRTSTPKRWRLAILLHDAPEYVLGDLITPFKAAMDTDYKQLENRLETAILLRFGLPGELPDWVRRLCKRADTAAAYLEGTQLAGFDPDEAKQIFGRPRELRRISADADLTPCPPQEAKRRFLARFAELAPPVYHPTRRATRSA